MQAPSMFQPGTDVTIRYKTGMSASRTIIEWSEQGIVTSTEYHFHFIPWSRISSIVVERKEEAHEPEHELAAAGVG